MSATVLYMSVSLDRFIAGPNEGPDNGLGDGGHRLHEWAFSTGADTDPHSGVPGRPSGVNGQVFDEFMATGAVVAGRGPSTGGRLGRRPPRRRADLHPHPPRPRRSEAVATGHVNDVRSAMSEAKRAAGDKNVLVHGAGTAQLGLAAGVLDEMELHVIPVLFGQGRRLFEGLAPEQIELERIRILEGEGGVTHMRYRVQR